MKSTSSSSLMLSSPVLGGQLENRRDILSDATVISTDPTSTTTFLPTGSVVTTTVLSSGTTITTTTTPADVSSLDDSSCDEGLHERHHHSSSSSSTSSSSSFSSLSSLKKTVTAPLAGTSLAGPTWCLIWLSINCGTTLMNKAMFSSFDFPYPVTLSLVHMFFTASLAFIAMHMQGHQMKTLDRKQHLQVFLFSLLFCVNILSGNIGIKYVTVALGQVVRAAIPGITMVLSVLILRKKYTLQHVLAVLVVVLGVSTATYGDLQFHLGGFIITVISCFLSSCKSITTSIFLVGSLKFHPMELAFRMSFLAFFEMGFSAWALGEFADMSSLGYEWASSGVLVALAINGIMAFLLNHSNFMFTRSTSALTVTVAGSVKNVLTILLGIVIFVTPLSPLNAFGTFITIIGASLYSLVDFRHLEAKKASALPAPSPSNSNSTPSSSVISASS